MKAVALELKEANAFVDKIHRHHQSVYRDKFRVGCEENGKLVGVANVGRPLSRYLDDGKTLEVLRLCTDGTKNACSFLYSRCARIAKELGYEKIITYILETESGDSLNASGWILEDNNCGGGHWNCPSRPRSEGVIVEYDLFGERIVKKESPTCKKQRWAKELQNG